MVVDRQQSSFRLAIDSGTEPSFVSNFKQLLTKASTRRQEYAAVGIGVADGLYLEFKSSPDFEFALDRLQLAKHGIQLNAAFTREGVQWSAVFVPDGKVKVFLKRFDEYLSGTTPKGHPRHQNLVDSIAEIKLATLNSLWTDDPITVSGRSQCTNLVGGVASGHWR